MELFNFKKKKEKQKTNVCACNSSYSASKVQSDTYSCCEKDTENVSCIRVLGSGCASCHQLYENTKAAVKNMGLNVDVEYITDMERVMEYGIMRMPALVVNENIVAMGKALKVNEVEELLCK